MKTNKNYFWSYEQTTLNSAVIVENILKYGDLDEIKSVISKYGIIYCKEIWIKKIIPDNRFKKLNYFLARFIFNISENKEDINKFILSNEESRLERIIRLSNTKN